MKAITNCRACGSDKLKEILNLGEQYLSDFRRDKTKPPKYPLIGVICEDCLLVQLRHTTPQKEMYHENYGFKSNISQSIKSDLKDIVKQTLDHAINPWNWLDIASNDGYLLSQVPSSIFRVGVDPVTFLCDEAEQHADRIVNNYFDKSDFREGDHYQQFDAITSISCFYDMPDPNKFVSDVKRVLAKNGAWCIQQNYLLSTMQLNGIDNFCHEHLEYYTLLSLENLLEKHDLEVFDLQINTVNGGSLRTFVARKGIYPIQDSVEAQRTIELDAGLDKVETYEKFSTNALRNVQRLVTLVGRIKERGESIAILAASTRGATIWQAARLGPDSIEYAVERNPEKVGKMFSAIGVPIVSEEQFRQDQPDYAIIGPWFFALEIIDRESEYMDKGGKLIIPLPRVEVRGVGDLPTVI